MNTNPSRTRIATLALLALAGGYAMNSENSPAAEPAKKKPGETTSAVGSAAKPDSKKLELATFGNGCFWCTEAVFEELNGVEKAVSGYSGGRVPNPTYEQVSTGLTGHAEVIQVAYDPKIISYAELLEVFWMTHDPTTLNRQGPDTGPQYRSAVFYHNDDQRREAEYYKEKLDESKAFSGPIVTEITKFEKFYPAEDKHQEYYAANSREPYCRAVIRPKVVKVRKAFKDKLKVSHKDDDSDDE
jgi:peptide-methionine (S)-S-oxide reductase